MNQKLNILVGYLSFFIYPGYYAGLALLFFTGFISSSRLYSIPLRVSLIFVMLFVMKKSLHAIRKDFNYFLVFFFSFFYILKIIHSENMPLHFLPLSKLWIEYCFYFISFCIMPFITFSMISFKKYNNIILKSIIFSGLIMGLVSFFMYKELLTQGIGRISMAIHENPDMESTISPLALAYGGILTVSLCLYRLIFEINNSIKTKLYLYLCILVSFLMFFLGSTRGSLVVLVFVIPTLIYFGNVKNKMKISALIIIAIPLIIYGAEKTGSSIFLRTAEAINSGDSSGREVLWAQAYEEFLMNPILGGRIEVSGIYPHNVILELLMSTGIVGFLIFMYLFIKSLNNGIKYSLINKSYLIPLVILINGFVQHLFTSSLWSAILIFMPMGILLSNQNKIELN